MRFQKQCPARFHDGLDMVIFEPLKLVLQLPVDVLVVVVECKVAAGICQVEVVDVRSSAESEIHQLLQLLLVALGHEAPVGCSLRLVNRQCTRSHERELGSLATNSGLSV